MTEQFKEQGGAATMDPSRLRRWLTSRLISWLVRPGGLEKLQARAERERVKAGLPHTLEYFHQVDDAYSHLAAQALQPLLARYGVQLVPHLVAGPSGDNLPEPELLPALGRYDAALVAPHYGLEYPADTPAPEQSLCLKANCILAAVSAADFSAAAVAVGSALLAGDASALESLAGQYGSTSEQQAAQALAAGTARRAELKHYSGGMFYYGGVWYWGVDRLYHLERRWGDLGLGDGAAPLFPRPPYRCGQLPGQRQPYPRDIRIVAQPLHRGHLRQGGPAGRAHRCSRGAAPGAANGDARSPGHPGKRTVYFC